MLQRKLRKFIIKMYINNTHKINFLKFYRNSLSSQSETEKICDKLKLELSSIKAEYKLIESSTGGQQKEKK